MNNQYDVVSAQTVDSKLPEGTYVLVKRDDQAVVLMNDKPHLFGNEQAAKGYAATNL